MTEPEVLILAQESWHGSKRDQDRHLIGDILNTLGLPSASIDANTFTTSKTKIGQTHITTHLTAAMSISAMMSVKTNDRMNAEEFKLLQTSVMCLQAQSSELERKRATPVGIRFVRDILRHLTRMP